MKRLSVLLSGMAVVASIGVALGQDEETKEKKPEDTLQKRQASLKESYRQFERS